MTPGPDRLWTGDWRDQSEDARRAGQNGVTFNGTRVADVVNVADEPRRPRPAPPRRGDARLVLAAGAAILVIAAGAFAVGTVTSGGGDGGTGSSALPAASEQLQNIPKGQTRAGAVYAAASPAVVSIRAGSGSGTGFLIDGKGHIVTNAHVAGGNDRVEVRFGADGKTIEGKVLGTDPSSDLAVVAIDPGQAPADAKPLKLADSRSVRVGDVAIAIGNPFGLDRTATEGIVSGVGREIQAPNGFSIDSVIQTDAPINPGNSGGPLLDRAGRVIGVNSQIATAGAGGNVGIGFAVPSNSVREVVPTLIRGDQIKRAYLGVSTSPAPGGASGARVESTVSGGPAEQGGIRSSDVITRVDGRSVANPGDVTQAISGDRPGKVVAVEVQRDGASITVHVTLGTRPASTP
jgi:S1-C subfamily serine protease